MQELDELRNFCEAHGLPWSDVTAARFATYVGLLEQFNAKMNLIGPMNRREIVRQLLIDSVAAGVASPPFGHVLDVGTGAGLPGIPLGLVFGVPITLVEPRQKRATFLKIATNRLGLEATIHANRIEDVELEPHDWLVSKAFRAPPEWLDVAVDHLADGGHIVCLHAANTIDQLRAHAVELGLSEQAHVADVARDLKAPVPAERSVTTFRR